MIFAYLMEIFAMVNWFSCLWLVKPLGSLKWVGSVPIWVWVAGYLISLILRMMTDQQKASRLKILGWILFAVSTLARPAASW